MNNVIRIYDWKCKHLHFYRTVAAQIDLFTFPSVQHCNLNTVYNANEIKRNPNCTNIFGFTLRLLHIVLYSVGETVTYCTQCGRIKWHSLTNNKSESSCILCTVTVLIAKVLFILIKACELTRKYTLKKICGHYFLKRFHQQGLGDHLCFYYDPN